MKSGFCKIGWALAAALLAWNVVAADNLFSDLMVARGKGVEVRRGQLDDAFIAYKANLAARKQELPEERRTQVEAMLLDRIMITQLLTNRASELDRTKARDNALKFLENTRKTVESEDAFIRQLRAMGMTPALFTNRVFEQALAEEVINREVKNKIDVTPAQVVSFYQTNDQIFRVPETARVQHLLLSTRDLRTRQEYSAEAKRTQHEKAERLLARVKAGEDFSKLILECSEDPTVKENKGEYVFPRAKDDPRRAMVAEFEAAAFSMKTNQVSDLVPTEYGYHIIKLLEITPPRRTPLTEAKGRIMDFLVESETAKEMPKFFKKLKEEAKIEVLDPKLAAELAAKPEETSLK